MASGDDLPRSPGLKERLNVSQKLIGLIDQEYPGTLTKAGDDYDWVTASGSVIGLSVRSKSDFPTLPIDPKS